MPPPGNSGISSANDTAAGDMRAYNPRSTPNAAGEIGIQLLSVLMPRERQFFTLFNNHASLVVQGAATLVEMLSNYSNSGSRDAYVA
jgi:hypothetical protein